jgi:GcrA cell cycle regulator
MSSRAWTTHEDERLRSMWSDRTLSAAEIGRRMGRGKNSIIGRAHRLRLPPRPAVVPAAAVRVAAARRANSMDGAARKRAARNSIATAEASCRHGGEGGGVPLPGAAAHDCEGSARPPRAAAGTGACARPLPPALPHGVTPTAARAGISWCRWPMWGDRERPTHRYCGAPVSLRPDGVPRPYCAAHAALAYMQRETAA